MDTNGLECISIEIEEGSFIDTFVCPQCSALVKNLTQHFGWHNKIRGSIQVEQQSGDMFWEPLG